MNTDCLPHQVKSQRPVANPNAGFLVKLLALDKALKATSAPDPARVYRMAPEVGGAVGRQVEPPEAGGALTTASSSGAPTEPPPHVRVSSFSVPRGCAYGTASGRIPSTLMAADDL